MTGSGHSLAGSCRKTESKDGGSEENKIKSHSRRKKRGGELAVQKWKVGLAALLICPWHGPCGRCLMELKRVGTETEQGIGLGWAQGHVFNIAGCKGKRFPVDMGRFMYSAFSVITPTHVDCLIKFNQVMN